MSNGRHTKIHPLTLRTRRTTVIWLFFHFESNATATGPPRGPRSYYARRIIYYYTWIERARLNCNTAYKRLDSRIHVGRNVFSLRMRFALIGRRPPVSWKLRTTPSRHNNIVTLSWTQCWLYLKSVMAEFVLKFTRASDEIQYLKCTRAFFNEQFFRKRLLLNV